MIRKGFVVVGLPFHDGIALVAGLGRVSDVVCGGQILGVDRGDDALDLSDGTLEFSTLLGHLDKFLYVGPDDAVIVCVVDKEA